MATWITKAVCHYSSFMTRGTKIYDFVYSSPCLVLVKIIKLEPVPRSKFSIYFKHLVIVNCFWDVDVFRGLKPTTPQVHEI